MKIEEGGRSFHGVSIGLKSAMARQILDDAKANGRTPLKMSDLAIEIVEHAEVWCRDNCKMPYIIDPHYMLCFFFEDASEAMLFKLSMG